MIKKQIDNSSIFLLLLELISKFIFSGEKGKLIAEMDVDTLELLCEEAENNRLGVLLYYYCWQDNVLPDTWLNKWSTDFRAMSAHELRRANDLKNIYRILADNNIAAAPLKGACLAYKYYPHPALRNMHDIDILIRPDNVKKAFQLMLDNGFTADYDFDNCCHEALLRSTEGTALELHRHIDSNVKRCDCDLLWEGCYKSDFSGHEISYLSPELYLLHAIIHAFKDHLNGGIRSFIDIAYILNETNISIEQLEACAKKNGFYERFVLFMNIFPEFFPKKYIPKLKKIPLGMIRKSRYLIYNFKHIQEIDCHQLMLHREYHGLSLYEKILFPIKKIKAKPESIAQTYNCHIRSPWIVFYYFNRIKDYFLKFILFLKASRRNSLTKRIGVCQKTINNYLSHNME